MSLDQKQYRPYSWVLAVFFSIVAGCSLSMSGPFAAIADSTNEAAPAQSLDLRSGGVGNDISAGETQFFKIALTENQLLRLFVERGDLALSLTISDEAGRDLVTQLGRGYGVMEVSLIAPATGSYRIGIHSLEAEARRHYQIRTDAPGEAQKVDVELQSAYDLLASASWLRDQWTQRSLQEAIENCDKAGELALRRRPEIAAGAINEAGKVLFLLGEYAEALKRFTKVARIAKDNDNRIEYASALSEIGRLQSYLGNNNDADGSLAQAFQVIDAAGADAGSPRAKQVRALALSNRGEISYAKGNLVKALADFDHGLALFNEVGDREGQARGHLFNAYIAGTIGEPDKAANEISSASRLYEEVSNKAGQALCLTAKGLSRSLLRDEEHAMALHREAAEIFRAIGDRSSEAITVNALGQAYENLTNYPAALQNYEKALDLLGENPKGDVAAMTVFKIARMQRLTGNLQQSLANYERCLRLSRDAHKRRTEATALNDVALVYASQGSRAKTVAQYEKILTFYRRISDRRGQAVALNNLGDFLASLGDNESSLDLYQRAVAVSELAEDKPNLISSLYNLARVSRDLGMLDEALQSIERATQLIEQLRSNVATPEFRTSYFAGVHKHYDLLIDVLMRCDSRWPGRGFAARAFLASENARARSLIDMRAEAGADIRQNVSPELIEQERNLQGLIRAQAEYQMDLSTQAENQTSSADAAHEMAELRSKYEQVEAELRDRNPRFLALRQSAPISIEQIQTDLIDQDSILLEYALGDQRSYLWAVSKTSFASYELPSRVILESAALDVYHLLTARQTIGKVDSAYQANVAKADDSYVDRALNLSRMLLGPALSQLGNKRILLVTEGALQYIPFDALPLPPDPQPAVAQTELPLLISTHEIVTLPSLSTLAVIRQEKTKSRASDEIIAVLADPVFSSNDDRVRNNKPGRSAASSFGSSLNTPTLRDAEHSTDDGAPMRLAHAAEEADAIIAAVPRGSTMLAEGFDATRETAMTSLSGDYRIVHFAAHGFVNKDHPELSGIVLSLVDRSGNKTNGFLPVRDIYNLNLTDDLVVLSACDTALGKDIKGEGFVGLTHSFLASGSRSVVASLWKVDDRATAVLMTNFYRAMLQEGLPPAAALKSAKDRIRREKGWEAPYFWAGFVLQGEYDQRITVGPRARFRSALTILIICVPIAAGLIFLKRYRGRLLRHTT